MNRREENGRRPPAAEPAPEAMLSAGAAALGLELTPAQERLFQQYLELLRRWNRAYNLTAVTTPREIVCRHFLDSLAYHRLLPAPAGRVLDLGCGAGFPGLPLAIVRPADRFLLVEARQKKVLFVRQVIDRLQLRNVASIHLHLRRGNGRNELGSPVAVMVTRALSLAGEVLPAAAGMLAAGGRLLLSATAGNREVFHRQLAASGFLRLVREQEVEIPFLGQRRYLLLAEKIEKQEDG